MIASLSLGEGVHGDRRPGLRLMERTEMIQLVGSVSVGTYIRRMSSARSPQNGRELSWPRDAGPLRASVAARRHDAAI
jgi:hypothetical protein